MPSDLHAIAPSSLCIQRGRFVSGNADHIEDIPKWVRKSLDPGEGGALEKQLETDINKGFALGPFTLMEIIEKHGKGWRCFSRFAIHQAHNGKWRAIDDGRKSGHN